MFSSLSKVKIIRDLMIIVVIWIFQMNFGEFDPDYDILKWRYIHNGG